MPDPNDSVLGLRELVFPEDRETDFCTTHWSTILAAGQTDYSRAAAALERLCQKYWYPIYAFIRRRGLDRQEAEDLTQAFFAHLLEKECLKRADQQKGRFRAFLAASLKNFLNSDWERRTALRRGGEHQIISLDTLAAEEEYGRELGAALTPEMLFERRWAIALLDQVLARLRQEYATADKTKVFAVLEAALTSAVTPGFTAQAATELGLTENATKVSLHRMRRRFGQLLRSEIAHTVASPAEVDDEIRYLFAIIST